MAKTPGATLYASDQASGSETLSSFLYAGRGRLRHHAGISGFGCWAGVGPARSPVSENAKRINRFKEVFSSSLRLLLFFTRECVIRRTLYPAFGRTARWKAARQLTALSPPCPGP